MELKIRLTVLVVETARLERRGVNDSYKQTIPWHQQHCCITNKSSKTNLIYEGSSCNLCNQHNGLTTSRWDITESHHFSKKTVMSFHNYEKKVNRKNHKNPVILTKKIYKMQRNKSLQKTIDLKMKGQQTKIKTKVFDE